MGRKALGVERFILPEAYRENAVLFLLTDLSDLEETDLIGLADDCGQEGISLRLACIHDPYETWLIGLGHDVTTGRLFERSFMDASDLVSAYDHRSQQVRHLIEQRGGRFVSLTTDLSPVDLSDRLLASEFLA